jgi:hypothetical protein
MGGDYPQPATGPVGRCHTDDRWALSDPTTKVSTVLHTAVLEPVRDEFWPSRRIDAFDEFCRR